ncbi:putative transcription factor MYB family [Dioscorea sansibarensis]
METTAAAGNGVRAGRLPRWTRQEILVLIEGKRVVEGRGRCRGPGRAGGPAGEPKWAAVSAYCKRHGVDRGPVQCRKRWSNLAGDHKKIKEWEKAGKESFWAMRNDARRERRLPGFFDREVFEILEGTAVAAPAVVGEEEAVFDSGRTAGEDGLFSDCEEEEEEEGEEEEEERAAPSTPVVALPISEKKYEPSHQETSEPGMAEDQRQAAENPEKGSSSREGQKRRRVSPEGSGGGSGDTNLQHQLIEILERNSRMLTAQLEAQNMNYQLDRDQRKDQADSLLGVLGKLADAIGRIADKL